MPSSPPLRTLGPTRRPLAPSLRASGSAGRRTDSGPSWILRGLAAAVLLGALTAPASAQGTDRTPPRDSVPPADSVLRISPLQVQVLRSARPDARAPYAVAALSGEALTRARPGAFLADHLVAVPGLQIQNRYNFAVGERLAVRGVGARSQFGVRGLRVFLDGVPATLPDGQATLDHVDPSALARVELLRGPGSALYGNGAGGVLLLETARPGEGDQLSLTTQGGSFGLFETTVAAERGAGDQRSRIQITRMGWDGFRSNPVDGGLYGEAERWLVTGRHEMRLGPGLLRLVAAGVELDSENPGSLPADSLGDPDRSAWGFNVRRRTGKEIRQLQAGLTWARDQDAPLDVTATAWGLTRDLRNPIPTSIIELDRTALGGRAAVGASQGPLRWDVGVEVEHQRDDRRNFANEDGEAGLATLRQGETVTGAGAYAALSAEAGPAHLHAALRYDRIRFSVDDRLVGAGEEDESDGRTLDAFSPSLGTEVDLGAGASVFASVSSFLQTPTTSELANRPDGSGGFNPDLEPTRGWTLEGGLRGRLAGRIGWEVLAFQTQLRDELIPFEVATDPGRTFFRNAGESRYRGFEAAVRAALPAGFDGRLAYTFVDARFQGDAGGLDGNRIPGQAPGLFEAVLGQTSGQVSWSLDVRWADEVPVNDANTAEAAAYWLLGARAGLTDVRVGGSRVEPWVAVRNVLDESYVSSVAVNAFGGRFFEPGPGRAFQTGVRVELGAGPG